MYVVDNIFVVCDSSLTATGNSRTHHETVWIWLEGMCILLCLLRDQIGKQREGEIAKYFQISNVMGRIKDC